MNYRWVLTILWIIEVMVHISEVEKPRPALTRTVVAWEVAFNAVLIYGIFKWV